MIIIKRWLAGQDPGKLFYREIEGTVYFTGHATRSDKLLVTSMMVLASVCARAILVTNIIGNIPCLSTQGSPQSPQFYHDPNSVTNIQKLSPTLSDQHNEVANINDAI